MSDTEYTCPRCHNHFPTSNKIMHDAHCTEQNPMPLDKSNQNIEKKESQESNQSVNSENYPHISKQDYYPRDEIINENEKEKENNKKENQTSNKKSNKTQEEDKIPCEYCSNLINANEYKDHVYCHQLQQQELSNSNNNTQQRTEQSQNQNFQQNNRTSNQQTILNPDNFQNTNSHPGYSRIEQNFPGGRMVTITRSDPSGRNVSTVQFGGNLFNPMQEGRFMMPFGNLFGMGGNLNDIFRMLMERQMNRDNPTDTAILNNLPETVIEDASKLDVEKKNCVICLEDFKNGDKATVLPCIHMFHSNCLQEWLKTQNSCPICKFKLTTENINNSYQ